MPACVARLFQRERAAAADAGATSPAWLAGGDRTAHSNRQGHGQGIASPTEGARRGQSALEYYVDGRVRRPHILADLKLTPLSRQPAVFPLLWSSRGPLLSKQVYPARDHFPTSQSQPPHFYACLQHHAPTSKISMALFGWYRPKGCVVVPQLPWLGEERRPRPQNDGRRRRRGPARAHEAGA